MGGSESSRQPVIPPAPLTGDVGCDRGDAGRTLLFFDWALLTETPLNRAADWQGSCGYRPPKSQIVQQASNLGGEILDIEWLREEVRSGVQHTVMHDGIPRIARCEEDFHFRSRLLQYLREFTS